MKSTTTHDSRATELLVDLGAIAENWLALNQYHSTGAVAAVVKADAYGLGAGRIAPMLAEAGCHHFFVAHLSEAVALRGVLPKANIAALNGLWPGDAQEYRAHDILPVLGSLAEVDEWTGPALLHIDTGMHRLGLGAGEIEALAASPGRLARIELRFLMTHLVSAEMPREPINEYQRTLFATLCDRLSPATPRSIANSSGIFLGPRFGSDLARPGAALYGINPTPGQPNPMRATICLRARILQVRQVQPGESVGYNGIWTAPRPSRIGVVSVGYADGYLRMLSNQSAANFDGARVPLVGRVSMDLTTFDLTETKAQEGDWLELIGPDMPVDAVATLAGTNGYEICTSLGSRYQRLYRTA